LPTRRSSDLALRVQRRLGQCHIEQQLFARMIAIEVPEAHFLFSCLLTRLLPAERLSNVIDAEIADIRLDCCVSLAREPEPCAMRMKEIEQASVRPVERVDTERMFARREPQRHRDEEAPFEGPDFRDVALDAQLAL